MIIHKPVLFKETIENLSLTEGDIAIDATLGSGGHGREILKRIGSRGKMIAIDIDAENIRKFKEYYNRSEMGKNIIFVNDNFANLENILEKLNIVKVNAILADLGWSSDQLADPDLGFSFRFDAPLDMRLRREGDLSAASIVNGYSEYELENLIRIFGEEKNSRKIAHAICQYRKNKKIKNTVELAKILEKIFSRRFGKIHPATKTFQAIRIAVNHELENLEKFLPKAIDSLKPGGRLAVISFHSLEDRIVKNIFRENARGCICPVNFPRCVCGKSPKIKIITKKPIVPERIQIDSNPRSRSAKLRVCERL